MLEPFDENRLPANLDPVDAPDQGFGWEELYERMREDTGAEGNDRDLAEVVRRLLGILVPHRGGHIFAKSLGFRLIALAWVLDPGYFDGNPSLRELAQRAKITPAKLSRYTGHYSRLLRWRNRGQRHAWNWRKGQR
jgi:hypothetical protein